MLLANKCSEKKVGSPEQFPSATEIQFGFLHRLEYYSLLYTSNAILMTNRADTSEKMILNYHCRIEYSISPPTARQTPSTKPKSPASNIKPPELKAKIMAPQLSLNQGIYSALFLPHLNEKSIYIASSYSTLLYAISNHPHTFSLFERLSDLRNLVFILFRSHIPHELVLPKFEVLGACDTITTQLGEMARMG